MLTEDVSVVPATSPPQTSFSINQPDTTINQPYHEQLYNETQAISQTMQGDNATQFVFPLYFPGYKYHGWPDHAPGEMGFVVPGVYEIQVS